MLIYLNIILEFIDNARRRIIEDGPHALKIQCNSILLPYYKALNLTLFLKST
jgi:hypothetical protein